MSFVQNKNKKRHVYDTILVTWGELLGTKEGQKVFFTINRMNY